MARHRNAEPGPRRNGPRNARDYIRAGLPMNMTDMVHQPLQEVEAHRDLGGFEMPEEAADDEDDDEEKAGDMVEGAELLGAAGAPLARRRRRAPGLGAYRASLRRASIAGRGRPSPPAAVLVWRNFAIFGLESCFAEALRPFHGAAVMRRSGERAPQGSGARTRSSTG